MTLDLSRRTWQPADAATRDERRRASLYVASIATSKDDATQLLAVLGLLPARLTVTDHGMAGYRAGCRCAVCRKANALRTQRQRKAAPREYLTEEQWQDRKNGAVK